MSTTVTKLYDLFEQASSAVRDLEAAGIPHRDISLVANNADNRVNTHLGAEVGAGAGGVIGGGAGLLAGLGAMAIPGVGPVVAAGWLVATAVGAVVGASAGGLLGSLTDHGIPEDEAHVYAEGVRRGGTLLSVKTDKERVALVKSILNRHKYVDTIEREAAYRKAGWSQFDVEAPPYTAAQAEAERKLYQ